jgi:aminoethylphosphonate catabolism LysR family transcriptional regulator
MLYTQIRSFHAVATEGGFTAASNVLHVGQPTITSQVRALEEHYGVELFHRRGRSVTLTEAGRGLFAISRRMMSQEAEAVDYLNALSGFHTGHLKVGAVGPYHVTEMLSALSTRYPDLELTVTIGNSKEMLQRLLDFRADVAVLAQVADDPRFVAVPYSRNRIVAFMRRDHPLARKRKVTLPEIAAQRVVLREMGSTTRLALEQALAEQQIVLERRIEIGSREAVWMAVQRGIGLGVVSEAEFVPHKDLITRPIVGAEVAMTEHVVYLAERRDSRLIRAFMTVIEGIMAARGDNSGPAA